MEFILLGLLILVIALLVVIFISSKKPKEDSQPFLLMQQQLDGLREQINNQLNNVNTQIMNSQKTVGERLDSATKVVADVQKGIGSLTSASERIFDVGKDIASLQEILKAPKLRGSLGELFLNDLLTQILPPANFKLQYAFRSGEKVDAVIKIGDGMVPVDAKFPLENFQKMVKAESDAEKNEFRKKFHGDVKRRIDEIADKYILPDEGTFDFALMYIPAENVYYETIIKDESFDTGKSIHNLALHRKVIPVSPNSFYAYLQAILLGLKGLNIEKSAKEIMQTLGRLNVDFEKFKNDFELVGKHLTNASNKYDDSVKRLDRFGLKLSLTGNIDESAEGKALE